MRKANNLDELLFEVCQVKGQNRDIMIFNVSNSKSSFLNQKGVIDHEEQKFISFVDVTSSIGQQCVVIEDYEATNEQFLLDNMLVYDKKSAAAFLAQLLIIVSNELYIAEKYVKDLQKVAYSTNAKVQEVLDNPFNNSVMDISLKNMISDSLDTKDIDFTKILPNILNTIKQYSDIDTSDEAALKFLKEEIELAIIDALPSYLSADKIQIDIEQVKQIIEQIQQFSDREEEDDAEFS